MSQAGVILHNPGHCIVLGVGNTSIMIKYLNSTHINQLKPLPQILTDHFGVKKLSILSKD